MQISNENVPPHQDVITSVYVYSWRCINFGPNDEAKKMKINILSKHMFFSILFIDLCNERTLKVELD